jgi:hypothetical protein
MASRSRDIEGARLDFRLRGGQRTSGSQRRVEGERRCLLQERGSGGQATARMRPPGRVFELGGDFVIRPGGGLRPVPGTPVRVQLLIGDLSQGPVRFLPVQGWR